ncbi:MAG: PqqD family peptide modification chaperone [Candidatus Eiseniibacteriota bacterium]
MTRLKKGATLADLTALLVELYGIDAGAAHRDALDFVNRLSAMGLVDERS